MNLELGAPEEQALIATAREAVSCRLERRAPRWPDASAALDRRFGAFVTLRSRSGPYASLRGCIGRITATESLIETVRTMAAEAAFEDPRFPPVSSEEYPGLVFEITVLSPMRRIGDVSEIEVGKHGVYLTKGWRSAVFLPQVATEQGWDRETLLGHLCVKAGLPDASWKEEDAIFHVFEGRIIEEGG